jgi:glycosyltransferase involved in cell wall biosynthesis
LETSIQALIDELGLTETVRLLGWVSDDLVGWNRAADLVVMPTQELEGFGLATVEALACGTPVIGTPSGATPELLRPLDPGLVSRDTSPEALADAIVSILGDPPRLDELAARARGVVHPTMSWARVADRHLALYEELACEA